MASQAQVVRVTPEEYLRAEASGEMRHEFVRGQLFDMVGGTDTHNSISLNIASALRERLRGTRCRVFMADMKVRIAAADVFYYPDVIVTCSEDDTDAHYKEHPCVIIEVLSQSTEGTDRREKFLAYERLASLREYVLVHQDRREAETFRRSSSDGEWTKTAISGGDELSFDPLSVTLPLSDVYEGVNVT